MKILIVEDNENMALILCEFFRGHETHTVTKLTDALARNKEMHPDLVILDCLLDDTTHASEAIAAIPQMREDSPETAILVYTGARDGDILRAEAIAKGAIGLVEKSPISLRQLSEQICTALKGKDIPNLVCKLEEAIGFKL